MIARRIPLVTGNLSVDWMARRLMGAPAPAPGSNEGEIEQAKALGFDAIEDYVGWGAIERREGDFDWSFHRANVEAVRRRGLRYFVYPWLHAVPDWFLGRDEFVPFRCLEHGGECSWPSIFAPGTLEVSRRFYAELKRELGPDVDSICVACPADYGEVGYPTGFGAWASRLVPPRDHAHVGMWAGDRHACEALERACAAGRAFADAYVEAMTGFVDRLLATVRALFPDRPLWIKVGHGGEMLAYGIDCTALARVAARHGAGLRTTQATLPVLHQKRIATPCRHFAVPLSSEPPVDVGRETVLDRLFCDAGSGVVEYFDYPEHMVGARDLIEPRLPLLRGERSECDVALLFPAGDLRRQPQHAMPPRLVELGETLRDRFDWDLVDETLIEAGALEPLRVLALVEGAALPELVQDRIARFVARGGALVVGPDAAAARSRGPLSDLLARAPDAGGCVELRGEARPSLVARLGMAGDSLFLSGEWHPPEDAAQFRGAPPCGERSRWAMRRASLWLPVRRGARSLVESDCWVHPLAVERAHVVRAGGVEIGRIRRAGLQRFAAWIPAEAARADVIELAFESETFTPAAIGAGPDERELGVAVIWVRLTEEGAPGIAIGSSDPPAVTGRVDATALAARGVLAHGAGAIVVCRATPWVRFTSLLSHWVETRSATGAAAPRDARSGERIAGIRAARFAERTLLLNRTATPREIVVGPGATRVLAPAGEMVAVGHARTAAPAALVPERAT